ncbi:hypothetical protein, partial [Pseudomonas chlororaphis]|uniref:hypothetical protein n=1 Tax=Pseudomonas chlororaphis TaxID=587753 RepID=UPI001B8018B0
RHVGPMVGLLRCAIGYFLARFIKLSRVSRTRLRLTNNKNANSGGLRLERAQDRLPVPFAAPPFRLLQRLSG